MVATRAVALNQVIAVRKGVQSEVHSGLTRLHHQVQKVNLLTGFTRTHQKIRDEDPDVPGEVQRVQVNATETLHQVRDLMSRLWNVTAVVDWTNCQARADVVIGDQVIIKQAPATFLIFLEKQLTDLHTIIDKLPVLDPADEWHWDDNADAWASQTTTTVRTKKEPRNHVLAPATEKHPAQVNVYMEDVPVGYWHTVKHSGAIGGSRKNVMLGRVRELREAVKAAREEANMTPAAVVDIADGVFGYLLRH